MPSAAPGQVDATGAAAVLLLTVGAIDEEEDVALEDELDVDELEADELDTDKLEVEELDIVKVATDGVEVGKTVELARVDELNELDVVVITTGVVDEKDDDEDDVALVEELELVVTGTGVVDEIDVDVACVDDEDVDAACVDDEGVADVATAADCHVPLTTTLVAHPLGTVKIRLSPDS